MVAAPPMKVATLKFPLLAALGTLFLLRSRRCQAFVWATIVFSFSLFLAHQFGYLHDLNTRRTEKQATYFVENISRPGYGGAQRVPYLSGTPIVDGTRRSHFNLHDAGLRKKVHQWGQLPKSEDFTRSLRLHFYRARCPLVVW